MHKFRGIKTSTPARAVALWAARSSWGRLESLQIHQMLPLWFFWTLLPNFFFLFFCSPCRHLRPCLFTITVSDSCHGNRHKQDPNRQSSVARPSGCHRCFLCSNKDVHCRRKKNLEPRPQTRRQPMKTCRGCLALRRFSVFLSTWGWLLKMRHKCGVFIHFDKCLDVRGGGFMSSGFSLHLFSQCYHVFLTLTCYSWLFKSLKCIRFQIWTQFN